MALGDRRGLQCLHTQEGVLFKVYNDFIVSLLWFARLIYAFSLFLLSVLNNGP